MDQAADVVATHRYVPLRLVARRGPSLRGGSTRVTTVDGRQELTETIWGNGVLTARHTGDMAWSH